MAWKNCRRIRIWGGGTNFSGELIMYYRSKGLNMAALCDRKSEEDKTDLMLWLDFIKILKNW